MQCGVRSKPPHVLAVAAISPSTGGTRQRSRQGLRLSLSPLLRNLRAPVQPFPLADSELLKAEITVYLEDSHTVVSMVTLS